MRLERLKLEASHERRLLGERRKQEKRGRAPLRKRRVGRRRTVGSAPWRRGAPKLVMTVGWLLGWLEKLDACARAWRLRPSPRWLQLCAGS